MKLFLTTMVLAAGMIASAANAAGPCGADTLVAMRTSVLTATGTPAGFLDAVKDHKAWYASHGFKNDSFVTSPAIVGIRGAMQPSSRKYVTFHVYGGQQDPKHDAAWDAYVTKYKANATIDSEERFCLPKGASIVAK
ncbi:hypothetical protein [Polymorphobacter megasporae]|uniref:hypothetical protein n=1 Tax=Glacieibacterium megasporae TaxID=2835787 RepID=UPI001C1DDEF6|nr:hypothetical protein [Polymorphobacter megasporae]UAJ10334.1 hypothetical protein KTC28_00745 [Polymorphobacter megasporae]